MTVGEQAWVTSAVDDATAIKALVLGRSLRRALTTRRTAVVISNSVTEKFRKLLSDEFGQVLRMDGRVVMNGLPVALHSKIFCWSLPFVTRVVYVQPDALVVRNSDELFDMCGGNLASVDEFGAPDTSLLVIKPDVQVYEDLLEAIKDRRIHSGELVKAEKEFALCLSKSGQLSLDLDPKYTVSVSKSKGTSLLARNEDEVSIVRFVDFHPLDTVGKSNGVSGAEMGLLEQAVCDLWVEMYAEDVQPKVTQVGSGTVPAIPSDFSGVEEPIAIVGMSCRFPGADNVEEYWDVLINGRDCIQKVPDHRWPSETAQEFREVQAGFLKCPVDQFDGKFFGISPADLVYTDPQQRLLMEVVWEALEDAAINPQTLKGTPTGVFAGSWTTDYRDLINDSVNIDNELAEFHRLYMGNSLGGTGGRLSYLLGLTGPNVATESGCSSGMVAIYLATESLRAGRCKVAIAGGVNLLLHPFKRKHMQSIIAPDGRCKTFDEKADGFGRGEGVASLILKKYSDAIKDGDRVYCLIRGTGISQEGTSRSFGTPTKECQELAMQTAVDNAGLKAKDICYVEAHGTGTMVGDPVEMAAITKVYSKGREEPLIVASVKTNLGHTESCSGFAGIIKVILALKHNIMPPHINLENVNPHINLEAIPAIVPRESMKWDRGVGGKPRMIGVSSFGITGTDAHIILQEVPQHTPPKVKVELERPLHLMTFSSKSEAGLDQVLQSYVDFLENSGDKLDLKDLAYTANTGRAHFAYRTALVGKNLGEIVKKLKSSVQSGGQKHIPEKAPKICFLFTGQGSQYEGMSKSLYDTCPTFKMNFDKCDKILKERFNLNLIPIMWPETDSTDSKLKRSLYSQTSIFCVEYALMKVWMSWGITPDFVLGHSLGEFAAATCAGILSLEDALTLVAERSRLIEMQKPGQMLVIKADKPTVEKQLTQFLAIDPNWLDFAAVNSSDQTVVAGPPETIQKFSEFLGTKNLKRTVLEATNAFHSRDMDPMLAEYGQIAAKVAYRSAEGPQYISGLTGKLLSEDKSQMDSSYWIKHTRDAVNFKEASLTAWREGARVFLEIGPQPVLTALVMANISDLTIGEEVSLLPSLRRKEGEWITMLNSVSKLYASGFDIHWANFDQFYSRSKVDLPFYPFSRKSYWYDQGKSEGSGGALTFNSANVLHPLLGHSIPNATPAKIYQRGVSIDKFPYLKDHAIGNKIIFPGAGYLEMCLAAGNASTSIQQDNEKVHMTANPVAVEGLTIEAPLGLEESGNVHIQTVVNSDSDTSETKISIYSLRSRKWVRQAVASFSPLPMTYEPEVGEVTKEPLSEILDRCLKQEAQIGDFYDKLAEVGLQFGPTFRSLRHIWRGENDLIAEIDIPEGATDYICHPVVLDALIQSIMVGMKRTVDTLFVPICIGKVVCFAQKSETATKFYAHCHWKNSEAVDGRSAVLYDDSGKILAFMSDVQMIETSVVQILKALDNQKLSLPSMYEEAWRPRTGIWKSRTNMKALARDYLFSQELYDKILESNSLPEDKMKLKKLRAELVYLYALRSFYDMGWKCPALKESINLQDFAQTYGILKSHEKFLVRLLGMITEEGYLHRESQTQWKIIKRFPEESQVHQKIREIHTQFSKESNSLDINSNQGEPDDVRVMSACGEQLSKILQGKASALPILFPEDRSQNISADTFYNSTPLLTEGGYEMLKLILSEVFSHYGELPEEQRGILRVLEVGAGTGSSTKVFLEVLEKYGVKYQYTFSDISPAFFIRAQQLFEPFGKKIIYKALNLEEDPKCQGFAPGTFDIVFASNVIHATKNLAETMVNVRHLLRDSGLFMLIETFQPLRDIDIVFGVLEGFWRFSDTELRPEHPFLDADNWCEVIRGAGHSKVQKFYCYDSVGGGVMGKASDILPTYKPAKTVQNPSQTEKVWLVFSTRENYEPYLQQHFDQGGRKVLLVKRGQEYSINESKKEVSLRPEVKGDMDSLFKFLTEKEVSVEGILFMWGIEPGQEDPLLMTHGFLFLAQQLLGDYNHFMKIIIVTEGIMPIGDQSSVSVAQGTLWGMARSFRSEHSNIFVRCIDLDPDESQQDLKFRELCAELWFDDIDYQVAYRQGSRHVCRFTSNKDIPQPLSLPNSDRFCLVLPETRNINDLKFCATGKTQLKEHFVEIQVKVSGLNFRDIFVVLKPDKAFEKYNTVGLEFAGVVTGIGPNVTAYKVGDRVIGCNLGGDPLPSHSIVADDGIIPMPTWMTFHEACTLPAAFATVYYCLVTIAQLKEGETVLIHAGSGGVGLYAIQVAHAIGAVVISTAGSRRKRAYIRSLGVKHVFHSRNTDYGKQIMEVTQGKGVHVVLNCLTSPGFKEASLDVCCKGARFVEISKMSIWSDEDVAKLRPDVKYWVIDLNIVDRETWAIVWDSLQKFCSKGFLTPIPYVNFDCQNIREALMYMQKAKHIGKVVITMPEPNSDPNAERKTHMFNDMSTYLITGGLGGIGLEVAKWMADSGAKHILLASRGTPTEKAAKIINELIAKGKNIVIKSIDVGDHAQCKELLSKIQDGSEGLPPLRGIMHAAGTLADATYLNQTVESYKTSFKGKVGGAWNLHKLTIELNCRLEHFVLYSSIVAIFGPIGLSNYAAGNTFLDALAHYRNAVGLIGQSINWGQWAEVGAAANVHITAVRPFTPSQGIAALEAIMKSHKAQTCVLEVDFSALRRLTGHAGAYLEEMKISKDSHNLGFNIKIERFWDEYNEAAEDKKKEVLQSYIEMILRQILKFDEDEPIDANQNFSEMGMDSLMMLEMKNFVQTMLGKNVTMNVSVMAELTTITKLVDHLQDQIEQMGSEEDHPLGPASYDTFSDELINLINKDMVLPDLIRPKEGALEPLKRSQVKRILLTGVTGKFGPHMLRAILLKKDLEKVYCIIRSKINGTNGKERLKTVLDNLKLLEEVDLSKVEVINGDISEKMFGLSPSAWEELGESIDSIVHCAVKGNLMDPYTRITKDGSSKGSDIRTPNVIGTLHVMELAVSGSRIKSLFHASTLLANQKTNTEDNTMSEEWYAPEEVFQLKNTGYPVSKFVCEVLLKQLVGVGVPVQVFRFPALLGSSRTGRFTLANNHAMVRLLGFCKLGAIPGIPLPIQALPSDLGAELALSVFWKDDTPLGVYNLSNPHLNYFHDIAKVSGELGFPIEVVEYDEFAKKLSQNEEYRALFPYSEVDMDEGRYVDFTTSPQALQAWIRNPEGYFPSKRMLKIFPDLFQRIETPVTTLRRDLQFAIDSGICDKFGIKRVAS